MGFLQFDLYEFFNISFSNKNSITFSHEKIFLNSIFVKRNGGVVVIFVFLLLRPFKMLKYVNYANKDFVKIFYLIIMHIVYTVIHCCNGLVSVGARKKFIST